MPLNVSKALHLPPTEFFPVTETKTGIALHHTVGGTAESTLQWWLGDREMVGTAYLIDRDGTVFEIFDPAAWAWQFGLKWPQARKIKFEKRFIGIEVASEGGLIESGGKLYCFDRVSPKTEKARSDAFDHGSPYRGYRYFDKYESAQVDALVLLVNHLCDRFNIPRRVPSRFFDFYGEPLETFEGIIGHTMVRQDKSDPLPDRAFWNRLVTECRVTPVEIGAPAAPSTTPAPGATTTLSGAETEKLFEHNVQQINVLNVSAGSMVKGLIMELERAGRNTYIRLRNPVPSGHAVDFDFVQGDRSLVGRVGRALGFKSVTDSRLEVLGG